MPNRCIAAKCSNVATKDIHLYKCPRDAAIRREWTLQVQRTRADWAGPSEYSNLCNEHFEENCFSQEYAVRRELGFGFKNARGLLPDAIPTIFNRGDGASTGSIKRKRSSATEKRDRLEILETILNPPPCSINAEKASSNFRDASTGVCFTSGRRTVGTTTKPKGRDKGTQTKEKLNTEVATQTERDDESEIESDEDMDVRDSCSTDPDYIPNFDDHSSLASEEVGTDGFLHEDKGKFNIRSERKYIVFWSSLLSLLAACCCQFCGSRETTATKQEIGSMLVVNLQCRSCHKITPWHSQPYIGRMPAGNILMSAAILFSGGMITKTLKIFHHMGVACICARTYFRHQHDILQLAVCRHWKGAQAKVFNALRNENRGLIVGGDGRADSPGHSAKYGTYSMIEMEALSIIDVELIQSNECGGSYHMEKAGLVKGLEVLNEQQLPVKTIITDRHPQITKYLKDKHPDIDHKYDIWHIAKGIKKKLRALAQLKGNGDLRPWIQSIVNHLYWSVVSTPSGDGDVIVAKWLSVLEHIQDRHDGFSDVFPSCTHGRLVGREHRKKWIAPCTKTSIDVERVLGSKTLCRDIRLMSAVHQTAYVEAFHSLMVQFAPKTYAFTYIGMYCRTILAALHFNENANRPQRVSIAGDEMFSIHFPKYKFGGHILRKILVNPTFTYVDKLTDSVLEICQSSDINDDELQPLDIPPNLNAGFLIPTKEEAIAQHATRFTTTITLDCQS